MVENIDLGEQDVMKAGPSKAKLPRIENSLLENLRTSLTEKITSEIEGLLLKSQKDLEKMRTKKTEKTEKMNPSVRMNNPQEIDTNASCNNTNPENFTCALPVHIMCLNVCHHSMYEINRTLN